MTNSEKLEHYESIFESLLLMQAKKATKDDYKKSINGRSLEKYSMSEIEGLIDIYDKKITAIKIAIKLDSRKLKNPSRIISVF